ncbi:MAG: aspartate-semialdehyde dehydrogenase [Alphaproteobacteria bacterium]
MTSQDQQTSVPRVGVVGATGAVGREIIACLERRNFPLSRLRLFASGRSAGQHLPWRGGTIAIEALDERSLAQVDIALCSAGSAVTKQFAPTAGPQTVIIDNSSAFRMDPDVPLVVTEVNAARIGAHKGIIANPNCVAIIASLALWPLNRENPIRRITAATYQSASGAGAAAMEELRASTGAHLAGQTYVPRVLPHPYAFNVFSHNTAVDPSTGDNDEEAKVARELRRIMDMPSLAIGITCLRVPVLRAHTIVMSVGFEKPMHPETVREILSGAPGVVVVDDPGRNHFPMPVEATGRDEVLAGRFRIDRSDPEGRTVSMIVAGDQLLKGAALNAVQIAELLPKAGVYPNRPVG